MGVFIFIIFYLNLNLIEIFGASIKKSFDRSVLCSDLPKMVLTEILGPAFNSRYMSIDKPHQSENRNENNGYKRDASHMHSFYVDDSYEKIIDDKPAWLISNHAVLEGDSETSSRTKRNSLKPRQWECESRISWLDLGPDYFPRYIRSVECLSKYCWYGHYKCKPRSFTVKLLRRRNGVCTVAKPNTRIGTVGLPDDLSVLWVWEERAVNFCCDCSQ